jgi:anti-sigma B factor antagonist
MSQLNISKRQLDDVTILDLSGDLTFGEGNLLLRTAIRGPLSEGKKKIFLNLANVGFLDSSGIGELVSGFTAINREGGQLKLFNLPQRVYEILTITKLLTVFDVGQNEGETLETVTTRRRF